MTGFLQVVTSAASKEEAQTIASSLVERELAACVQVAGPVSSTYRWRGKVETSEEWLCIVKTRESLLPQVEAAIHELHSYDVPEFLALPLVAGSGPYLQWLHEQVVSVD
jgi:periplasmic divalent cation tolerance protein